MKPDRTFVMDIAGMMKIRSGMDISFASMPVEDGMILMRIYLSPRIVSEIADLVEVARLIREHVNLLEAILTHIDYRFNQLNENISLVEIQFLSSISYDMFQLELGDKIVSELKL